MRTEQRSRRGRRRKQVNVKSAIIVFLLIFLLFFIGAMVVAYPVISNIYAKNHQLQVVQEHNEAIADLNDEERAEELEKAYAYNRSLVNNRVILTDPFDPNAPAFPDGDYYELLAQDEVMAELEIPAINEDLPVYHGTGEDVLSKGVGHLEGTSLPVGGTGTHAVLSAHSGLSTALLFTNLEKLKIGNVFYIHVLGETLVYRVDQINIIEPTDTSLLGIDANEDYVTLITCTPYGVNSHRLLVRGKRSYEEITEGDEEPVEGLIEEPTVRRFSKVEIVQIASFILGMIFFIMIIVLVVQILRQPQKKEEDTKGEAPRKHKK